jgi:hypothetical protein
MRQSRRPAPELLHSETRHCHPQPHNGEVAGLGSVDAHPKTSWQLTVSPRLASGGLRPVALASFQEE